MTLTEFLLARIAEDEAAFRSLLGHDDWWPKDGRPDPTTETPMARVGRWEMTPARVIAECEAKRRIVESCREETLDSVFAEPGQCGLADEVNRVLALPYADHPDYREEWKP